MNFFFLLWIILSALLTNDIPLLPAIFGGFPLAAAIWLCLAFAGFDMDFLEKLLDWREKDDD